MIGLAIGFAALFAAFWKSLGKLAWPFCRKWLSRGPSFGFAHLLTLERTSLREKALQVLSDALAAALPFKAAGVEIGYISLSLGFLVGVRLHAHEVKVLLERLPEEAQWQGEKAVRNEALNQSAAEAQKFIGLVANAKKSKAAGMLPRLLEMFISGTRISVEGLHIIFQDPAERQELCIGMRFHLRTSRSRKIEFRGTEVSADAEMSIEAGGEELLSPVKLDMELHLPKVLRTLLVPMRLPKKTALASAWVNDINLRLQPKSVAALMKINSNMSRFSDWKKEIIESEERIPLTAAELRRYTDAVKAKKKELSEWEQRMTTKEILNARCLAEAWPLPAELTLEAWLEQLAEEQRPLRSLSSELHLKSFTVELLQEMEIPGMGCFLRLENLKLGMDTLDPELGSTDAFLLSEEGLVPKMKASMQLASLQLECEAPGTQAASVLRPCTIDLSYAKLSSCSAEVLRLKLVARAVEGRGLTATVSSRAVWRLQRALQSLQGGELPRSASTFPKRESSHKHRHGDAVEKIRVLFEKMDVDQSGKLEKKELQELLESIYGRFMAPKEILMAAEHLMYVLGRDKAVALEEEFFQRERGESAAKAHLCLHLNELTKPVPSQFKVEEVWADLMQSIERSKAFSSTTISPGTLQLYWVRTLENYAEAKRLWEERLKASLEPRLQRWVLQGDLPAIDVWSDASISLRTLAQNAKEADMTLQMEISMDGLSVRLADTQHASSVPRAKLDLKELCLMGGLQLSSDGLTPLETGLKGSLQLSAEYWNQSLGIAEPFVEPWSLQLDATPSMLLVRAEDHLVLNLTPPLMQALTVASNSLAVAKDEAFEVQQSSKPVAVWVYNRTLCDVRVAVRNPEGERSAAVEISRWSFSEPVALELATRSAPLSVGNSSGWVLEMELRGGDADTAVTGMGWWVRKEIGFSTTGRRVVTVGQRHDLLCVSFSVDVTLLAPVVSLSGIGVLQNMTSNTLTVSLGQDAFGTEKSLELEPYQSWKAGIGGGYEVTMPVEKLGHFKAKLPLDADPLDDREKLLERFAGYRFVLLAHEGRKNEPRDRVVVCVPMLSVLNALPCEFECSVRKYRKVKRRRRNQFLIAGDPSQQEQVLQPEVPQETHVEAHTQSLTPGQRLGFKDVDPEMAVEVVIRMAGFTYRGTVPAKCLKSKTAVARARSQNAHLYFDLSESRSLCLISEDAHAPKLSMDLEWEMHGAVFLVYSHYWVADKTGWGLDVWSVQASQKQLDLDLTEQARASPMPATGAWKALGVKELEEDLAGQTPHLALMNLHLEQIQLRLLEGGCKSLSGWFWNPTQPGETLQAWWGTGAATPKDPPTPPAPQEEGAEAPQAGWLTGWSVPRWTPFGGSSDKAEATLEETGWSSLLSVGILGSTGVAQLPAGGLFSQSTIAAEVGVSVSGLPAPFERTKLVSVVPRYLVRNQLPFTVELWPSRGSGKQAPNMSAHLVGTWTAADAREFQLTAPFDAETLFYESTLEDGFVVSSSLRRVGGCLCGEARKNNEDFGELRLRLRQGALLVSRREREGDWGPEISFTSQDARASRNPSLEPGQTMSIGGIPSDHWAILSKEAVLQPMISFRVSGEEGEEDETRWSTQVALSAVGDSVIALQRLGEDTPLLVRASIQLEGSMLFLVLSRGHWPFEIENRSARHTVIFRQAGTDVDQEWVTRPCEVRRFVFPDPEKQKTLEGRILGAGQDMVVSYELDNISAGGVQQGLRLPGRSNPALLATLQLRGSCRRLVLRDHEAAMAEIDKAADDQAGIQEPGAIVKRMAFDIFFAGLHICLADTLNELPEELLAFTVDYIQLEKPSNERSANLTVHHIQLDDFGDEDYFLLGPMDSGFNSRTLALSDRKDFAAVPLLSLNLQGDRSSAMYDSIHRAITLKTFGLALRPMEARVDVPRLLYVASRLKGWTSSLEPAAQADAIELLDQVLMTVVRMPSATETTCSVGFLQAQAMSFNLDVKLTQRQGDVKGDVAGDSEFASQLRKQASKFGALQPIIEFFGRLGASFADVAPRFRFSPLLITDASADLPVLQSAVARHYIQQLLQQSARLVGSLQLLGDPANLMDEIGSGVMSFFSKTKEEVLGERAGLGSGVSDLTESIVGGALQSVAKISGSLKDTVGSSLGQPIGSDRKAMSVREGLDLGYASIAVGLSEGISSVVKEPLKQANEDGLVGLASGTALGAASMVVRPLEGLLGAAEKLAQGAEGAVRGRFRGFCGLRRPPRVAFHQATGLQPLAQSFFWPMWLMMVEEISLPILWSERSVQSLVVYLRHHGSFASSTEVSVLRSCGHDRWCAEDDQPLAVGRVGQLRGPSTICVDAVLETNLEFAEPSRTLVAYAEIDGQAFEDALVCIDMVPLTLELRCAPNSSIKSEGKIGHIGLSLGAALDPKILPVCFMPQVDTACNVAKLGPAKTAPAQKTLKDIERTQQLLAD